MDTLFNEHGARPPQHSDFTMILGCVLLSIVITGGTLLTAKLVMHMIGWQ